VYACARDGRQINYSVFSYNTRRLVFLVVVQSVFARGGAPCSGPGGSLKENKKLHVGAAESILAAQLA